MIQPTQEQWQAMARMAHDSDFKLFVGWLSASLSESDAAGRTHRDEINLRQNQGSGQTLDNILTTLSKAAETARAAAIPGSNNGKQGLSLAP